MTIRDFIQGLLETSVPAPLLFLVLLLVSWLLGRYMPRTIRFIIHRFSPQPVSAVYDNLVQPIENSFKVAAILIFVYFSLNVLTNYPIIYSFLGFFINLFLTISLAWLASRIFRQFVRIYAIDMLRKIGREVDELLLVFETLANVIIGFVAVVAFAQSQNFNLIGLVASLGIGGLAVAFAAQKILEQLLSTIVLYLDRPFVPGDYIRLQNGELGRVESIGLRSTKIRTSGKSTLFIVPNSNLLNMDIENVTRAKKVMVLLYLDFSKWLEDQDRALVQQTIVQSTDSVFGIDPGSTNITFNDNQEQGTVQARVSFFILGSSENSLQLRKRLLELANHTISAKLKKFGIEFSMEEPTIYVESPITL